MILQIFNSDIDPFIILGIVLIGFWIINRTVSLLLKRSKKVSKKVKMFFKLILRLISVVVIIFFVIQIPVVSTIFTQYPEAIAIFAGSTTTALAFASSGIFSNIISGMFLFSLKPFEVGDLIEIDGEIGVVRRIKLTTTLIETFDNIIVEKANNDVIRADILNYTIKLSKIKTFLNFKKEIYYSEGILPPSELNSVAKSQELNLKTIFKSVFKKGINKKIHNYIFTMEFPYKSFHLIINKVEKICDKYTEVFGFKPMYHITEFYHHIVVRFRILTTEIASIFQHQPEFAKEIYTLIFKHYVKKS